MLEQLLGLWHWLSSSDSGMKGPLVWAIPVLLAMMVLEALVSALTRDGHYDARDLLANLGIGMGNAVANLAWSPLALAVNALAYAHTPLRMPPDAVWAWVLLFFLEDLCYYASHRAEHGLRILWASHQVHHSSERFNLSIGVRTPWLHGAFLWVFWVPLALLGFSPLMIVTQQGLSMVWQFFSHTGHVGRLGPLEHLLSTPSNHRVHHARNPRYLDRNFGGVLILWDRLFGTYVPEREPPDYGVPGAPRSYNPFILVLREWGGLLRDAARAPSWRKRLRCLVGPP
jgi:sterol desaturase/sphingolipid hydroxylase (fatty acid hydroxylase superfamily)